MKTQDCCNGILFYISTIRGGGAARVMVNLANDFCHHGKRVYLVTNFQDEHEYQLCEGVTRLSLEKEENSNGILGKNLLRIQLLRRVIREIKPNTVVSFMDENNIRLILASLFIGCRVIISVRNDPKVKYRGLGVKFAVRCLYWLPNRVVFQTEEAKNWFQHSIKKKSVIIQNQINQQFYITPKVDDAYYVAIGRLSKQKNYPLLIDGFHDFLEYQPKAVLRIYGNGELKDELMRYIEAKGCTNSIYLMGQTDKVPDVLARAKCYILTSNYEGMPNALLEAMAVGLPVISTDCPCGGPAATIENKINGLLFPVGNKDELVKLLIRIEDSAELRAHLSSEAKRKAEHFAPDVVFKEWEKCLCED